jgi:predicted TIM-barrel fold metal-dependent hydrolase
MMPDVSSGGMLPGAIDVHGHFITPAYRLALDAAGIGAPDGLPRLPDWSPVGQLELMDRLGIAASVLAISSPGIHFGDDAAAAALARSLNDEIADLVREHPARFALAACLPLPDVAASLAELERAYDELSADAIALLTNVNGSYLGEPAYEPLMAELDRRHAVVVLHPTAPAAHELVGFGRPSPILEFPIDTTRTVFRLILDGVIDRHPRIRWIVPHSGSALAVLADRVHDVARMWHTGDGPVPDVIGSLQGLHYDLAGPATPRALPALLGLVGPDRLLYGSDHPFPPVATLERFATALESTDALSEPERAAMFRANALELFPRLAT